MSIVPTVTVRPECIDLLALLPIIPDFPKPGIKFRDISPLLADPAAFKMLIADIAVQIKSSNATCIVGLESRGFVLGAAIALILELPFVAARKAGKLPGEVVRAGYSLEYGEQVLELQKSSRINRERVAIVDDLLATGGTAKAAAALVQELGGEVSGFFFAIELRELQGAQKLPGGVYATVSL